MLIRTSIVALALALSACGGDPVSTTQAPVPETQLDGSQSDVTTEASAPETQLDGGQSDSTTEPLVPETQSDGSQAQSAVPELNEEFETASGLIYQIIVPAEGSKPNANSVVTLHYVGTLDDGTIFDSSYSRGAPATFELTNTILGFKEGVQLMSVGSRYRFTIPANLAYGDRGVGDVIGPGATLTFEVVLLEINS